MTFFCVADACDGETKVMQTGGMYRRRKCLKCSKLFITEEVECEDPPKSVFFVPRDERKQRGSRQKQTLHGDEVVSKVPLQG